MCKIIISIVFSLLFCSHSISQSKFDFQIGYGYLEHFSTGIGLKITENNKISILLGSNFFMQLNNFVVYQLQYEYSIRLKSKSLIGLGLKGGYSIYSDKYYKWEISSVTPIINLKYNLSEHLNVNPTVGMTYSRVSKVRRKEMGAIGWYRMFLPEIKLALLYDF